MRHYPARHFHARLDGLSVYTPAKPSLLRRRWPWFYLGCALTATLAGFLAGWMS